MRILFRYPHITAINTHSEQIKRTGINVYIYQGQVHFKLNYLAESRIIVAINYK